MVAHQNWPASNSDYYSGTTLASHHVYASAPNQPPGVSIVSPGADGYVGLTGNAVSISASASDSDGIQRVEYYSNGNYLGSSSVGPNYTFNWTPTASGEFSLVAKAFDNLGASANSTARIAIVAQSGMPSIPSTFGTADQYFPMVANWKRQKRRALSEPNGPYLYTFFEPAGGNTWNFYFPPNASSPTVDFNNTEWETWELKTGCANGSAWVYVNQYHARVNGSGHDSNIATTLALLDYGGAIYDVTSVCAGIGQPYVPANIPGSGIRMRVWGVIGGSRPFYWEGRFSYSASITNTCWQGAGSSTRSTYNLEEAWWDGTFGWGPGTGSPLNGTPTGLGVTVGRLDRLGLGAGYSWYHRNYDANPNWEACTVTFEDYTP